MLPIWPKGFPRIPWASWTGAPVEELALGYDTVERHGWYRNLEPTLKFLTHVLKDGDILLDYSGGTGILAGLLLKRVRLKRFGILIVDSSPKFLRLALEKFRDEERVAFRRIAFLPDEKRLQTVSEVLEESMLRRGIDLVVSTNAIHLYYNLADTVKSWRDLLGARGRFHVQSGNILNPKAGQDEWIIDQTVETIHQAAMEICRSDSRFAPYREVLDDPVRMAAYDKLRRKYFLPPRPLDHYLAILEEAGFSDLTTSTASIPAKVAEWRDFLRVYLEGPLGWVGGTAKIEGYPPTPRAVKHRELLLDLAMARVFGSQQTFKACWTYINGQRGPGAA